MNKLYAGIVAIGLAAPSLGCAGLGLGCEFSKGKVAAGFTGDAKAFLETALELKKTWDPVNLEWEAEMKSMGEAIKAEGVDEKAVLARLNTIAGKVKLEGKCEIEFDFNLEASASGSAEGSASGGSGGGSAAGKAAGSAKAKVDVKFNFKCEAEAKVEAEIGYLKTAFNMHLPNLLGLVVKYKAGLPKVKDAIALGGKVVTSVDPLKQGPEIKCAVSALTGFNLDAKIDFSVSVKASASGSAKAGG